MIVPSTLLDVLVDVSDTLVDDYDLVDFLNRLTNHAAQASQAGTVGLVLADETGQLQFMAASSEDAKSIELLQLQAAQGPCRDCFDTGVPVSVPNLRARIGRWPQFAPKALDLGAGAVHAFPLRLRGQTIGALNVFSPTARALSPDEAKVIQAMADIATIGILQERALTAAETLASQLQNALTSRIIIEQAKGVLAQTLGIDVNTAFALMRSNARRNHRRLPELAADIVSHRVDFRTWQTTIHPD